MEDVRIILSGIWTAKMLSYLLGDVMRIFAGDFVAGEIDGVKVGQMVYLGLSIFMLIPIVMVVLSMTLKYPLIRWVNIIVPLLLFGFNLLGFNSFPGVYDKFLLIVGLGFNVMTVWYAWKWV